MLATDTNRQDGTSVWDTPNDILELNFNEEWLQDIDLSSGSLPRQLADQSSPRELVLSPKVTQTAQLNADFNSFIELNSPLQGSTTIPNASTAGLVASFNSPTCPSPSISFLATTRLPTLTLVSILLDIPTAMLHASAYPPFVHHNIYDCPSGESVPTAIANAFCALKAYDAAVGASTGFVYRILNSERERLVKDFENQEVLGKTGGCIVEALAAVHAMCAYQIIGFFDGDVEQVAIAGKWNGSFLGMARKLIQFYNAATTVASLEDEGIGWQEWRVLETVLRTIHVVHAINVVSARKNGGCYEPLDDEMVLGLPLPCTGSVWRAATAVEWARTRRKRRGTGVVTIRELVKDEATLKGFVKELSGDNGLRSFQGCDDLTKLILSCIEI